MCECCMRRTAWCGGEDGAGTGAGAGWRMGLGWAVCVCVCEGSADTVWQYAHAVQYECTDRHRLSLASKGLGLHNSRGSTDSTPDLYSLSYSSDVIWLTHCCTARSGKAAATLMANSAAGLVNEHTGGIASGATLGSAQQLYCCQNVFKLVTDNVSLKRCA